MGNNFHTPWTTATKFRASEMTPPITDLDKICTYNRPAIVHCDGAVTYAAGILTWSGTIHILFTRTDGVAIHNSIAAGSKSIADNQFAYVSLNETDNTVLTMAVATVTTGSASNFIAFNTLVLGYRNTTSDRYFPVALAPNVPNHVIDTEAYAATIAIDMEQYDVVDITLTDAATINFSNGVDGQEVLLRILQDGTGSRVATWGTMCRGSVTLPLPTLTVTADKMDYVKFRYNLAATKYDCVEAILGF